MTRKWFQLVDEDGSPVTNVDIANADIEDVVALRKEVTKEYNDSFLAGIAPSDLTVFENGALTEALEEDASIESFGGSDNNALVVQVLAVEDQGQT
ncbi:hypothetical protein P3T76_008464 [Phytophthora citrophthora]|uniref:Uncharacterized protein n=1 Tax=Phytophthora citrophthora TaxID=4793 RepID=A0AAD9GL70_9STRA|nr:hypothetical protein P3T76_008464 [Phytophthora citrophthora]